MGVTSTPEKKACWKLWKAQGFTGEHPANWGSWCTMMQRNRDCEASKRADLGMAPVVPGHPVAKGVRHAAATAALAAGQDNFLARMVVKHVAKRAAGIAAAEKALGAVLPRRAEDRGGGVMPGALADAARVIGAVDGPAGYALAQQQIRLASVAQLEEDRGVKFDHRSDGKVKNGQLLLAAAAAPAGAAGAGGARSLREHAQRKAGHETLALPGGAPLPLGLGGRVKHGGLRAAAVAGGATRGPGGASLRQLVFRRQDQNALEAANGVVLPRTDRGTVAHGALAAAAAAAGATEGAGAYALRAQVNTAEATAEFEAEMRARLNAVGGERMLSPEELLGAAAELAKGIEITGEYFKVFKGSERTMKEGTWVELSHQAGYDAFP
jgi:hypothetical protein